MAKSLWLNATLTALALCSGVASADPCRITSIDAFAGVNGLGEPGALGLKARVDSYGGNGLMYTMGGSYLEDVNIDFHVLTPEDDGEYFLASARTDNKGTAQIDLASYIVDGADGASLLLSRGGSEHLYPLTESQYIQVIATTNDVVAACDDGVVYPDVYGSIYYRHPDDMSPLLVSDFDDTLFNSADVKDVMRAMAINHWTPLDNAVVTASRSFRESGAVILGLTAQPHRLRPFTRSELLWWSFDESYVLATHNYMGAGYNETYLPRGITYIANDEYADSGSDIGANFRHCDYKVEKLELLVDEVLGGDLNQIFGVIGDSESSDGCAAASLGLYWYALMEQGTSVSSEFTGDYVEIASGWAEALPILCEDGALSCAP